MVWVALWFYDELICFEGVVSTILLGNKILYQNALDFLQRDVGVWS